MEECQPVTSRCTCTGSAIDIRSHARRRNSNTISRNTRFRHQLVSRIDLVHLRFAGLSTASGLLSLKSPFVSITTIQLKIDPDLSWNEPALLRIIKCVLGNRLYTHFREYECFWGRKEPSNAYRSRLQGF
jgi:hypothetical protein